MNTVIDAFLPQRTQDSIVGRKRSWTGVVVCDLNRTDEYRGHYWRVSESWRDPETEHWSMWWHQRDYLGSERPKGKVYKYQGSWDMKAYATTVFPWIWSTLLLVIATVASIVTWHMVGPNTTVRDGSTLEAGGMSLFWYALALQGIVMQWLINVEPVRGTKVAWVVLAADAAWRIHQKQRPSFEQMMAKDAFVPMVPYGQMGQQQSEQQQSQLLSSKEIREGRGYFMDNGLWIRGPRP